MKTDKIAVEGDSQNESLLADLLRVTLPHGGYVLAFAHAYFDESGTGDDSAYLCVAGYVFTKENALAIEPEWNAMLAYYGLPYFHMAECNQHDGIYAHLDEKACIAAATEAIALTKKYASQGIAISFDKKVFDALPPQPIWTDRYSFLCSNVMFGVLRWAEVTGFAGDVSYFYESGAKGWGDALQAMRAIRSTSEFPRDGLRFKAVTSVSKRDAIPLQCADLLVWNWHKQVGREARGIKNVRGDFKSLLGLKCDLRHYDQAAIDLWTKAGSPSSCADSPAQRPSS
jgi:hypothetical protein